MRRSSAWFRDMLPRYYAMPGGPARYRFGAFEFDCGSSELRKSGLRIHIEDQPGRLLCALLARPGEVVPREDLKSVLWDDNTNVEFDRSLTRTVNKVRSALGDSASNPRFIETLPRRGYRFVAPVTILAADEAAAEPADRNRAVAPRWWSIGSRPTVAAVAAATCAIVIAGGIALTGFYPAKRDTLQPSPVPLTSFRGREVQPALSPDGSQVAFAWNGEQQENYDIYVMPSSMNAPVRITSEAADDISPAWSPDGRYLAFIRRLTYERGELIIVPSAGGPEHKLTELHDQELQQTPGRLVSLTWSPGGQGIAASHRGQHDSFERIYLFALTGEKRPLTTPQSAFGDHAPSLSHDGRSLAFSRLLGNSASEIAVVHLDDQLRPVEEPRQITFHKAWSVRPLWTRDGRSILYLKSEQPGGKHHLRRITRYGSETASLPIPANDDIAELALATDLVYSTKKRDINLWRFALASTGVPPPEILASSTLPDAMPRYSPDGKKLAFVSARSGTPEIWIATADGRTLTRLTSFHGPLVGQPSWSPDGQYLVFHARPHGQADLFVLPAAGGRPKQLTDHPADDTAPAFSADGKWIDFANVRTGREEIWRMPANGGTPVQLTTSGGCKPAESRDGGYVFYIGKDGSGIRRVPVTGGMSEQVVGPLPFYIYAFAATEAGIYYPVPESSTEQGEIRFYSFATRSSSRVVRPARNPGGMTVSPDGRYLVMDQAEDTGSDLMLIRNFQPY